MAPTIEEQLRASRDPDFWTTTFFQHRTADEVSQPERMRHWFKEAIEVGQRYPGGLEPEQVQAAIIQAFGEAFDASIAAQPDGVIDPREKFLRDAEPAMKALMARVTGRPLAAPGPAPFDQDAPL
ncbi:MAG: hypothetical protein KGH75_00455 [Rhodospirillales bacterium]|nr:hypothetical protein [Rhodospirillales bacterium]